MIDMSETELQTIVVKEALEAGWWVKESSQGSQNRPNRPARTKSNKGYPDLTLARNGEVLFIELKDQKGDLSLEQVIWAMALPRYHVIRPSDIAIGRLTDILQ